MQKKYIAMLTAAAMLLGGCNAFLKPEDDSIVKLKQSGAGKVALQSEQPEESRIFTVPYNSTSPLSPFKTSDKLNLRILPLIYDGLFATDENYRAVGRICESYTCEENGTKYTLNLRHGLRFSDGAELTAADVKYSLEQYKTAKNQIYKARAESISRIEIPDSLTVEIYTQVPDGDFAALLTMPIVLSGTADDDIPVGIGRYIIETNDGEYSLIPNTNWYGGANSFGEIRLFPILKTDDLIYALTAKNISFAEEEKLNSEGAIIFHGNLSEKSFDTPNMQYLCFNTENEYLADPAVRKALSTAINRRTLCENIFSGFAQPAVLPINPNAWFSPKQDITHDKRDALSFLSTAGFYDSDGNGIIDESSGRQIPQFTLLINQDNSYKVNAADFIAQEFCSMGIQMTVERVAFSEFKERLEKHSFDIALCETALRPNFDITEILECSLNFGRWKPSAAIEENAENLSPAELWHNARSASDSEREEAYSKFAEKFLDEMPFAPLCFEKSALLFNSVPQNARIGFEDIFANVQDWSY